MNCSGVSKSPSPGRRSFRRMFGWSSRASARELLRLPLLRRALPAAVEPEQVDHTVLRQQLAELRELEGEEALPLLGRRPRLAAEPVGAVLVAERRVVRVVPVEEREVEADPQPGRARRVDELAHQVAAVLRVHDREAAGRAGRPEREAVVVLRGQHRVAHAGGFRARQPVARGVRRGLEARRGRVVVVGGQGVREGQGADPADQRPGQLDPALRRVPPVHEQPEAGAVEPIRLTSLGFASLRAASRLAASLGAALARPCMLRHLY